MTKKDLVGKQTLEIMKQVGWYNDWLFSFVRPHLSGRILEIGGGIGNFTKLLSKDGNLVTIDFNKEYLKILKKNYSDKGIEIGYGDIEKGRFFFGRKKFDTIVIMNVLEHIKRDDFALVNMRNLLRPHGKLIILVPAFNFSFGSLDVNLSHFRRYSLTELKYLLEQTGFKNIRIRYLNSLGILGWFVNARLSKKTVIPLGQLKLFNVFARPFLSLEKFVTFPFGLSVFAVANKSNLKNR